MWLMVTCSEGKVVETGHMKIRDWLAFSFSWPMVGLTAAIATALLWQYFYLSTAREQFIWIGADDDQADWYLTVLNICIPAAAIPTTFIFSYINSRYKVHMDELV